MSARRKNTPDRDSAQLYFQAMMKLTENQQDLSPGALALRLRYDSLLTDQVEWRYNYVTNHTNFTSYFIMQSDIAYRGDDPLIKEKITKTFPRFKTRYPTHSYTGNFERKINAWNTLVPGHQFTDLMVQDIDGKMQSVLKNIKGKIAVVDFWGTWCAPCIAKTQQIAPLYAAYKDKGFTIIGIAREFKNLTALQSRLSKESWNWLQLLDIDDKNQVWKKYGLPDGGGQLVLVDKNGKIISMNAKPEEIKAYLEKEIE